MTLRDVGFFLRGRVNRGVSRVLTRGRPVLPLCPRPLDEALRADGSALAHVPLLEARSNAERETAVARYLETRGVPFTRHRFSSFEGEGENFVVELGGGDRVLVLVAHHDAVAGSPGANDNAAGVAILLHLLERVARRPPSRLRVRFLFPACEELGYLGTRAYVRDVPPTAVIGVLSLELCGIGDSLAVWDAPQESGFLTQVRSAFRRIHLRPDEDYHFVGRIPVFGSDHRAFAALGIPAYGLSVMPFGQAEALRRFVLNPIRSVITHGVRRPPPFDTYHTSRDASSTLDPSALDLVVRSLTAIVSELS
jgi:aminopeptidase YwaD